MMLKVFPDDDLGSTAHDRKKEQEKDIHMTPIAMMPFISMLALPDVAMCSYLEQKHPELGSASPLCKMVDSKFTSRLLPHFT
ncbi:hypothetical protein BHE74_00043819 [Ensete ventricosum]|nr:hypothetical protein BHE74_00043819 [Ensete ventricosum]